MLTQDTIDAFNSRLTIDLNSIKSMPASELDRVKAHGSTAEALMKNRDLALFIHQYKFELADALSGITGHTQEDNNKRVAISNQLVGLDGFIATLKRAVYMKNRVVTQQTGPTPNIKKVESHDN
jgi:hypothetical protein